MKQIILTVLLVLGFSSGVFAQNERANAERLTMQGNNALQWGYFDKACEYYQKAVSVDPKYANAHYYWGVALTAIAGSEKDEKKYKESFEKYKKATKLDPNMGQAYNDWACALVQLGKDKNKVKSYSSEAESLLIKSEKLGEQMAAYNLGCLFALQGKKEKAVEWLDVMMKKDYKEKMQAVSRSLFDKDEDFDNIRQSNEFIQFLNTNFPNSLPNKFQAI